ncbi:hypothetical protein ABZX40_28295 [Streptomyces sp. NPDC004610]|uniref:hypothetical protein n=1 Tax=unclassified Streptomyces TaxID=2593676 RepID=UPI0033BB10A0
METKLDTIGQGMSDLGRHVADHESRLRALEAAPKTTELEPRVTALEGRSFPLPSIGALTGIGALVVAVIALLLR